MYKLLQPSTACPDLSSLIDFNESRLTSVFWGFARHFL